MRRLRGDDSRVSAHAGIEPEKGASALQELAHQVLRINALQDLPLGVSVNVTVASGGSRTNVIPAEATALVDVRVPTMPARRRGRSRVPQPRCRSTADRLSVTGGFDRPPLERTAAVARLTIRRERLRSSSE